MRLSSCSLCFRLANREGSQAGGQAVRLVSKQYWQTARRHRQASNQINRQKHCHDIIAIGMLVGSLAYIHGKQACSQAVTLASKHIGRLTVKQCPAHSYPQTFAHMHVSSSLIRSLQIKQQVSQAGSHAECTR